MKKQLLQCLCLSLMMFTCLIGLNAQVTTSSLSGNVTDNATKEVLIGATVIAKHMPTGTTYGATTNEKGNYSLNGLRPGGPYTVEVSYIGYTKKVFKDLTLALGNQEELNVWLGEDAQQLEQVFVVGNKNASFNAQRTGAASNFGRKAIDNAPNISRSLFDVAKLTPQANVTSSGISFAGSNSKYNSFQIDGTVSNDVFGLTETGTNGGKSGSNPISIEAIDALQIVIAPYDVRQSGFTGGGINAITKSGTNTFKGSFYDYFYNQDFMGTTPGKLEKNQKRKALDKQYDNNVGFTLGGPIIKDKLFFFVNGEWTKKSYPSRYHIGDGSKIKKEEADRVLNTFKRLTDGYDGGGFGALDIPTTSFKALARIDYNINRAHKLSLRYSFLGAKKTDFGNKADQLLFKDRAFDYSNYTNSIVAELNSRFNNMISNELRIGFTSVRDTRTIPGKKVPSFKVKLDNNRTILIGSDPYAAANRLDQDVFSLTDNLTLNIGDHSIVFGTHNELYNMYNLFIPRSMGEYTFASLEDFEKIGTADEVAPQMYDYITANEKITNTKLWGPRFKAMQLGFYLQDEWKATDRLRLTYGVRMDMPIIIDNPRKNDAFNQSAIAKKYDVTNDRMPKLTPLWSPRVGFRYSLDQEKKYLIRGGAGIFTGRIPFVWISNVFTNTGVEFLSTSLRAPKNSNNIEEPNFKVSLDPNKQYIKETAAKKATSEVDFVSKNFKFPQVARFNLAFEAKLPWGIQATLEGMYSKNLNDILYRNLNVEKVGDEVLNANLKRPLFKKIVDGNYTYLMLLDNTDKGYSYNLTATLSKDFDFGLSTSLAYTYGKSEGVMSGTAAIANSSWRYQPVFSSTNNEELSYSNFDVRHRIVANLNYRVEYFKHFATTIGLYYNGQSGPHYSLMYNADMNQDGEFNDLMYIPTEEELKGQDFVSEDNRNQFNDFIKSHEDINEYRGKWVPRNALSLPFLNRVDLHFAQDFYFNVAGKRHTIQINADIENLGNLLNREWGLSHYVKYGSFKPLSYKLNKSTNKSEYNFSNPKSIWHVNDIDSRWHAQIGVKYIF